jgi:hypothetical protein
MDNGKLSVVHLFLLAGLDLNGETGVVSPWRKNRNRGVSKPKVSEANKGCEIPVLGTTRKYLNKVFFFFK